jgi:UDP-N-acetylmuramate-alanine ligase
VTPEQFGDIVIRSSGPSGVLRLKDVARIELDAANYDAFTTLVGKPTAIVAIFLQSGANALSVADRVRSTMENVKKKFPPGIDYVIPFDTTKFVNASIKEVVTTLIEAMLLVALVVYVFLQNWRATVIPLIAVPVSLIGTFAGLWSFGFSVNTLTLFAMVLSIGIVVDDAIVVLENVERLMAERQMPPKEAALEAMREVSGAVVAIVLVLSAVFIPVAFLGGIASNYNTNFWSDTNNVCVIEADEYDRSFLKLNPDIAIITAMDPDHLDIYETKKNFSDAFVSFSEKIKKDGLLICKEGLERFKDFHCSEKVTYDLSKETTDAYAKNITSINGSYQFDVMIAGIEMEKVKLNMGGLHNIENAIAAIFVAKKLGISDVKIKEAIATFQGVKRRFEYVIKSDQMVMIDDYAHHPSELEALIKGVRGLFPGKKCSLVFQPHLYSRTRDFVEGFANALSLADEVFLLPIYPAREKPIKGITSELIAEKMGMNKVVLVSKEELLELLKNKKNTEVLIMAGAGDIDSLVMPIKNSILI